MTSATLKVKFAPQNKPFTDVVGLEVGAAYPQGVPAVRVRKRDGKTELVSAGFIKLEGTLPLAPEKAEEASPPFWSLPRPFQAPHAALAVTSPLAFLRHASGNMAEVTESKSFVYRTASRTLSPDLPPLSAGIPEFQAAWAAHLFPEGHPPTTCSLQVSPAAALNTFMASPLFSSLAKAAVVLFVFPKHTSLAAFHDGKLVLYRETSVGYAHLREAIGNQMHIDESLADSILDDTVVDPTPTIEPLLRSLFRQVEISYDYLTRRRNYQTQQFYICGLPSGEKYWTSAFSRILNFPLKIFRPFEGLAPVAKGASLPKNMNECEPFLLTALGAARAVLENTP